MKQKNTIHRLLHKIYNRTNHCFTTSDFTVQVMLQVNYIALILREDKQKDPLNKLFYGNHICNNHFKCIII